MIRAALRSTLPAPPSSTSSRNRRASEPHGGLFLSSGMPISGHQQRYGAGGSASRRRGSDESDIIRPPATLNNNTNTPNNTTSSSSSFRGQSSLGRSVPSSSSAPVHFYSSKQRFDPIVESTALENNLDEEPNSDDDDYDDGDNDDNDLYSGSADGREANSSSTPLSKDRVSSQSFGHDATFDSKSDANTQDYNSSNTKKKHRKQQRHQSGGSNSSSSRKDKAVGRNSSRNDRNKTSETVRCPVCNRRFDPLMTDHDQEDHITACLKAAEFSGSPEQMHRPNRMVVYRLPAKEANTLGECVICFEEFGVNDSVGRLECFCVYHEKCILDWFARKGAGECPVHAVHT